MEMNECFAKMVSGIRRRAQSAIHFHVPFLSVLMVGNVWLIHRTRKEVMIVFVLLIGWDVGENSEKSIKSN